MRLPSACYRLQFRNGMDFDRAAELAPYLARLGISHLYASPLFTAKPGSTHGYDVIDPNEIEPEIGGRAGLERLSEALSSEGLGLILDIVPNHMAFSVATPWLRDVLRCGTDSRYFRYFDFLRSAGPIRLPWLAGPFETVLADDGFTVEADPDGPVLAAGGLRVPLAETKSLQSARSGKIEALRALHSEQPWRLVHWRTESDILSHRRFFNISGLIGVRVDDPEVFQEAHRLLFELVDEEIVNGIRIDHIDGLADPADYLDRLRARVGDTPIWVEKILSGDEALPYDWPVEGTTGYVAAGAFTRLLTDDGGGRTVDTAYRVETGRTDPIDEAIWQARHQIMTQELAAELWALHAILTDLAADDPIGAEFGPEMLREAILAYVSFFPRYRSYTTVEHVSEHDATMIHQTAERAAAPLADPGALFFLADVLTRPGPASAPLRQRMQQVTSAAVAKSMEDTLFFREVGLLSANEVGSGPEDEPLDIANYHRAMATRAERMPHGLTLTSSHDTKRSEDARMRIAAITHAPDAFLTWTRTCKSIAPEQLDANLVWYIAQCFLALDRNDVSFADRLADHVIKAMREAKTVTFWTAPDHQIEDAAKQYVHRLAEHFPHHPSEVSAILEAADRLSLMQTALKLTVPGIPDIYQGCEIANYALTDPDNRRPVDFLLLNQSLTDPDCLPRPLDKSKFVLSRRLLRLRKEYPSLFLEGSYVPLIAPTGVCAFERRLRDDRLSVFLNIDGGEANLPPMPRNRHRVWPPKADKLGPVLIYFNRPVRKLFSASGFTL